MKIVIIEDEKLTAGDLKETLESLSPDISVISMLHSVSEATLWFGQNHNYDLIFSDIQLGDGLCFDIFSTTGQTAPVIFCTAYDEYALSAFKANGIDYILKPFDTESVKKAIEKFNALKSIFASESSYLEKVFDIFSIKNKPQQNILLYQKDKIVPVRFSDIALIYIENEILYLITFNQIRYTHSGTMDEMESRAGIDFFRVNRQFLVNRKAIREASRYFERKLSLHLTISHNETVTVSKNKVTDFLKWLEGN